MKETNSETQLFNLPLYRSLTPDAFGFAQVNGVKGQSQDLVAKMREVSDTIAGVLEGHWLTAVIVAAIKHLKTGIRESSCFRMLEFIAKCCLMILKHYIWHSESLGPCGDALRLDG